MRTLALIPARAGSKGIPHKNTRILCGKPLWAWAYAIGNETCDQAWISTNDPGLGFGMTKRLARPPQLAQDDTPMLPVVQHALDRLKADVVVLLQPTQPLRTAEHVRAALRMLEETKADSVVSVVEIPAHLSPDYVLRLSVCGKLWTWLDAEHCDASPKRRQDVTPAFYRDGTVYAIRREVIEFGSFYGEDCRALRIPANESCTIDTPEDWDRAEALMRLRHGQKQAV